MKKSNRRELNHNWRGGRVKTEHGYILLRVGMEHHLSDCRGYAYEHRVMAERKIGRRLKEEEQVHHINGKKDDNRIENLEVYGSTAEHRVVHRKNQENNLRLPGEPNPVVSCLCGCGKEFLKYDSAGRPRKYVSSHNSRTLPPKFCACGCGKKLSTRKAEYTTGHRPSKTKQRKESGEIIKCACGCGGSFRKYDKYGRSRCFISGHNGRKNNE